MPGQPEDSSGRDFMFALERGASDEHYLLPLPDMRPMRPSCSDSGLTRFAWATSSGRWHRRGPAGLRVAGVQHPPPALTLSVHRVLPTAGPAGVFEPLPRIVVTPPHATAV